MDCFVASLPCANASRLSQAMTDGHDFAVSPHTLARGVHLFSALCKQRARGIPGARCTRSLVCEIDKAYEHSHHGHTGETRHSPRDGFNGYCALSLVRRAFWPPSPALRLADLTPASGCQDHTSSSSAERCPRQKHHPRPSHPAPRVRDDRERPSSGTGHERYRIIRIFWKAESFCIGGLT